MLYCFHLKKKTIFKIRANLKRHNRVYRLSSKHSYQVKVTLSPGLKPLFSGCTSILIEMASVRQHTVRAEKEGEIQFEKTSMDVLHQCYGAV